MSTRDYRNGYQVRGLRLRFSERDMKVLQGLSDTLYVIELIWEIE